MKTITFSVRFHQPFLVRSGLARGGVDSIARIDAPLPASSLKGAMRAASVQVLEIPDALVNAIYGRSGEDGEASKQGAWAWTDAGPSDAFVRQVRVRNRVDPTSGVALAEALTFSEEYWHRTEQTVTFCVEQIRVLDASTLDQHVLAIQAASYAVTALGSWRNRGMGAVTIRPIEPLDRLAERGEELR